MRLKRPVKQSRGGERAVRIFTCKTCGHKIRFGSSRCGYCNDGAPLLNRKSFWTTLLLLPVLLVLFVLVT